MHVHSRNNVESIFSPKGLLAFGLKDAVFKDKKTKNNVWQSIIKSCHESGLEEVALELLAAVTVLNTIQKAQEELVS